MCCSWSSSCTIQLVLMEFLNRRSDVFVHKTLHLSSPIVQISVTCSTIWFDVSQKSTHRQGKTAVIKRKQVCRLRSRTPSIDFIWLETNWHMYIFCVEKKEKISFAFNQPVFPLMAILSHVDVGEESSLLLFHIFKPDQIPAVCLFNQIKLYNHTL